MDPLVYRNRVPYSGDTMKVHCLLCLDKKKMDPHDPSEVRNSLVCLGDDYK